MVERNALETRAEEIPDLPSARARMRHPLHDGALSALCRLSRGNAVLGTPRGVQRPNGRVGRRVGRQFRVSEGPGELPDAFTQRPQPIDDGADRIGARGEDRILPGDRAGERTSLDQRFPDANARNPLGFDAERLIEPAQHLGRRAAIPPIEEGWMR